MHWKKRITMHSLKRKEKGCLKKMSEEECWKRKVQEECSTTKKRNVAEYSFLLSQLKHAPG